MKNKQILGLLIMIGMIMQGWNQGIFADHYEDNDIPFLKEKTTPNFIYSLGFYANAPLPPKIYNEQLGVYYIPEGVIAGSYDVSLTNAMLQAAIPNQLHTGSNLSHLLTVLSYTVSGNNLQLNFPIVFWNNNQYAFTYKFPIYNSSGTTSTKVTIQITDGTTSIADLCPSAVNIPANTVTYYTFTITSLTLYTIKFTCVNSNESFTAMFNSASVLSLSISSDSPSIGLMMSYYLVTVDVGATTRYTRTGIPSCAASSDCLEGYMCSGSTCVKCHDSCRYCTQPQTSGTASTSCLNECNRHSLYNIPTSGKCGFDYVDLSQFADFSITNISPPRTNRVTLGFWVFIADLTAMNNGANIFHVSIADFFVISITSLGPSSVDAYCTIYQKYNYQLETQTTFASFASKLTVATQYTKNTIPSNPSQGKSAQGRWFHTQCAMSFDHETFYLNSIMNDIDNYNLQSLPKERFYSAIDNDVYFRKIYRNGEYLTMNIKNIWAMNTKIFLKNLVLFQEYIPYYIHYMYHDMYSFLLNSNDFPEVIYILPFSQFNAGTQYIMPARKAPFFGLVDNILLTPVGTANLAPPISFKRLKLLPVNEKYSVIDLKSSTLMTLGGNDLLVYKDTLPMACTNNNWINFITRQCFSTCDNGYITFPGISSAKGYCNYQCTASMSCNSSQMATLINSSSFCNSNIPLYYTCVPSTTDFNIYFSSAFTTANIVLDIEAQGLTLRSYFIEFWYFPDYTSISPQLYLLSPAPENRNYVFYSNAIRLYINKSNNLHYLETSLSSVIVQPATPQSATINQYEWNKIILNVIYDGSTYTLQGIINNSLYSAVIGLGATTADQKLTKIMFCHLDPNSCNGQTIYWASGFYKNLRIWDGDKTQPFSTVQYNDFYPNNLIRVAALKIYLPMSKYFFQQNSLSDPITSPPTQVFPISYTWNNWSLRLWNYSSKFDYVAIMTGGNKVVSSATPVLLSTCPTGCNRCWSTTECYSCNSGYFLYLKQCLVLNNYYFKSPDTNSPGVDAVLPLFLLNAEGTITFWVKPIGFKVYPSTMIQYSSTLKLVYLDTITSPKYGLSLYYSAVAGDQLLANVNDFRNNFGQWIFISLAYYNYDTQTYFPPMMKFEIGTNSYAINLANLNQAITINQFTISNNFFGLVYNVKAYTKFIIGAYAYENNSANPTPPFISPPLLNGKIYLAAGTSVSNCYSPSDITNGVFACQPDYDPRFAAQCNVETQYQTFINGVPSCTNNCNLSTCRNACYGSSGTNCACLSSNNNSQMFILNGGALYCQKYQYINWAKAASVTINNVQTAKATKKFTMQFWVFAYSYVANQFGGLSFVWNGHNTIQIIASGGNYYFKCTITNGLGTTDVSQIQVTINQWNFLSCAADFTNSIYYLNTNNNNPIAINNVLKTSTPSAIVTGLDYTTLTITDDTILGEWGALFYSQIRLWKEAYFNADFVSRINILTPSLFPYLANSWNPLYNNNNLVIDINGIATSINVVNTGSIGTNVIDSSVYGPITLCSENGQYYDASTSTCLQFTDLSKMSDFTFTNVPVSYTGSYTMAYWIFVEDYTTLTSGVHINWSNHLQISIQTNSNNLRAICFPQGYYADGVSNADLNNKMNTVTNYASVTLTGTSGVWFWIICGMSNFNQQFYLNDQPAQGIITETFYQASSSSYPFRYFMSALNEDSSLSIQNISNSKKIYFRSLQLFKDYIPYNYDMRYVDLSVLNFNQLPSLVLVCNFANFITSTKKLTYAIYTLTLKTIKQVTLTSAVGATFELSANFIFLPLCNPTNTMRYNSLTKQCVPIANCNVVALNAVFCMDEGVPLACNNNYYISIDSVTKVISCGSSCPNQIIRTPGALQTKAICNSNCNINTAQCPYSSSSFLSNYSTSYTCKSNYFRINYNCIDQSLSPTSALFFSRCYKPPNVYKSLSNATKAKISNGYIIEFWFKMDTLHNSCTRTYQQDYYFYSTPHSIYLDITTNTFYYNVINTAYGGNLQGIQLYEWNKILIKTVIGTSGQYVYVYVNFKLNSPDVSVALIPLSTNMQLQSISFCSSVNNGDCTSAGVAMINWGSAFYRNLRVWDLKSATNEVVQAYNNKLFTDNLKSLILFYPLTVQYIDTNVLSELNNNESIVYKNIYLSSLFYTSDEYLFYNYATNFDWGANLANSGKYINSMTGTTISSASCSVNCNRCYSSSNTYCYECVIGYVLINQTCTPITSNYLKTPVKTLNTPVSLRISDTGYDLTTEKAFTLSFYMKFEGVIQTGTSASPAIITLNGNTYLAYDITTTHLYFYQNNQIAFDDANFGSYIGKWIPIVISNYISNSNSNVYPNMLTLSVNRIEIPFKTGYAIPSSGVAVNQISLGYEIVALFAELRVYKKFMQGAYGTMTSTTSTRDVDLLFPMISMYGSAGDNCLQDSQLASGTVLALGITCSGDYNQYLDTTVACNDNTKYLDPSITTASPPCASCNVECETYCYGSTMQSCTCDLTNGLYWLRRDKISKATYCDYVPYVDFSIMNPLIVNNAPSSQTPESTIELWVFIYSYNTYTNNFREIDIEWSLHNKIVIYNTANSLKASCFPLYDTTTPGRYSESSSQSFTFFQWNLIRCGTDLRFKQYFFNSNSYPLLTNDIPTRGATSAFKIYSPAGIINNFGFIFLREIKLWQQYNFKYIDSSYINIKSYAKYPGLLSYYKTEYGGVYEVVEMLSGVMTPMTRILGFTGYNIIDPDNLGYYSSLTLCEEGYVYNTITAACVVPPVTHCEFPGDLSDNCITCPTSSIYILPTDGSCVHKCIPTYYEQTLINQCRPCDITCYTCTGILPTQCKSCTGLLYFNPQANTCIANCETVGLTMSLTTPNTCVIFDASATLVNVSVGVPIDINTFNTITASVYGATAPGYTTQWGFDSLKTIAANNNNPLLILGATPFTGDTTLLSTPLNHSFFQLSFYYIFFLNIIKSNNGSDVVVRIEFKLTMNSPPMNGKLTIVPSIGLYNTTTFVMTCNQWTDDSTSNLQYQFYAIEQGTSTVKTLSAWSGINEIYSSFTVLFYQQPSSTLVIYCEVRDQYMAKTQVSSSIVIANNINGGVYSLSSALASYVLPAVVTNAILLARSVFLKSLAMDMYKQLQPDSLQTIYDPSLDQSIVTKTDPKCTPDYCNSNGYCDLVDISLTCHCELGFLGTNCQVDKTGYAQLQSSYNDLYAKVFSQLQNVITYDQFRSLYNLFSGASLFSQDPTFFSTKLDTFLTLATNLFQASILNNTIEYIDLFDHYYTFAVRRLTQMKLDNKNLTGYLYRNATLTSQQQSEYKTSFTYIIDKLTSFLQVVTNQFPNMQKTITYDSNNFYIGLTTVNPTFSDTNFFKGRASEYKSYAKFMKCLNYIEIQKLNNPYYQAWLMFIEFKNNPYSYNDTLYKNNTSPLIIMKFIDATTGKDILINDCTGDNALSFYMPFTSYEFIDSINIQKWLYDPNNYKSPDDPVFSDPIYINSTGFVSNDTIETRIQKYNRKYNFSCTFYNTTSLDFSPYGINYTNFTSDSNYIVFQSSHLTQFTTFFVENNMTFKVQSRFFYLARPQVFIYWPNYTKNYAFYLLGGFIALYFLLVFILSMYDVGFFQQESLLEFLKKEIVKAELPYHSNKEAEIDKLVPTGLIVGMQIDANYQTNTMNNLFQSNKITNGMERDMNNNDEVIEEDILQPQILTLNKFNEDGGNGREMETIEDLQKNTLSNFGNISNNNTNQFTTSKKRVQVKFFDINNNNNFVSEPGGNDVIINPYVNEADIMQQTRNTMKKATMMTNTQSKPFETANVNKLPKVFEDPELAYTGRLDAFGALTLSLSQFMCHNIKERHILISPLFNISVFNPRWKKLTLLITDISIMMLLITVQMTADPNATTSQIGILLRVAFVSVLVSNVMMYVLAFFFIFSHNQRRRLYKLVTSGGQLIVLKEWEEMVCGNALYTVFGIFFNVILWAAAYYFSVLFVAVWNEQALSWLICFIIAFVMEFILLEILYELFIGIIYMQRNRNCFRVIAEFLNRSRNYRCLWP